MALKVFCRVGKHCQASQVYSSWREHVSSAFACVAIHRILRGIALEFIGFARETCDLYCRHPVLCLRIGLSSVCSASKHTLITASRHVWVDRLPWKWKVVTLISTSSDQNVGKVNPIFKLAVKNLISHSLWANLKLQKLYPFDFMFSASYQDVWLSPLLIQGWRMS